ncbi:MAG: hypothetical protein A2720_03360 [Candidatus Doudnabacteria bacterium RIFCSPHIGHO2_01_FULL_46_24]|uniref:Uncharacterized protein n=1 Tax=Candidatus Doudnabacteria bacterium RIFCSPHIGHO2_01_FULL_46_24 TaxID=1817825 RepID=A0A1F5NUF5_9BACT|nr:MAG: hypothetical protein A2720_03360 [Candidatus Doudnabacteria bacterium RIFCSPHIGHO2_01_FULL_46_24]
MKDERNLGQEDQEHPHNKLAIELESIAKYYGNHQEIFDRIIDRMEDKESVLRFLKEAASRLEARMESSKPKE